MNVFDVLFSLAILVLVGIHAIYWHEARRGPAGGDGPGARDGLPPARPPTIPPP